MSAIDPKQTLEARSRVFNAPFADGALSIFR